MRRIKSIYASVTSIILCLLGISSHKQAAAGKEPSPSRLQYGTPPADWPQCPHHQLRMELTIYFYAQNKEIYFHCSSELTSGKSGTSKSLPSFVHAVNIPIVCITRCGGIRDSYADLLARLNVTGYRKFIVSDTVTTTLNSSHLVDLNVTTLEISTSIASKIYLDQEFLKPLANFTEELLLNKVSLPPLPPSNRLKKVFMNNGISRGIWGGCMHLLELNISRWRWNTTQGAPPPCWLANCTKLQQLSFTNVDFKQLSQEALGKLFVGLKALKILEISNAGLERLPSNFLTDLTDLTVLNLSINELMHLPSKLLLPVSRTLHTLMLSGNLHLSDLCDASDDDDDDDDEIVNATTLLRLPSLRRLSLSGTNASRICASWSRDMPALTRLELRSNKIHKVRFRDIKWLGAHPSELHMTGSRVRSIVYDKEDYLEVKKGNCSKFAVKLFINLPLLCDCHSYWFARSVAECPEHVTLSSPLRCSSGLPLSGSGAPLSSMVCERYPDECAPACTCYWREREDATVANCSAVADGRLPLIPHLRELNAASSQIETLEDIPETILYADLQHNKISSVSAETAAALFSVPDRRINLAGNPIICDCKNEAFIQSIQQHELQVEDYNMTKCADGREINSILIGELCALSLTLIMVYSLSPAVVLLIMALASFGFFYRYQETVKIFLYARGWCSCWINERGIDRDKKYDAFVSYSHVDEHFVYRQLIPELEGEPHCFKLCIHTRDWVVGEWIPVQVALSVEESRRTIILLSSNFLDSVWGRLEFRTAHKNAIREGRSRVIIVLLEEVGQHQNLDKELKAYLNTNTYVKWGDPHFWQKLRSALPQRNDEYQDQRVGKQVALELQRMQQQRPLAITAPPI
ncbi:protein toll-like [Aphomia sociella]